MYIVLLLTQVYIANASYIYMYVWHTQNARILNELLFNTLNCCTYITVAV